MTQEQFDKHLDEKLTKIKELLTVKGKEYAPGDNVFANFVDGISICSLSQPRYLWALLTKHLVSIKDIISKYEETKQLPSDEYIEEKLGDAQSYLILLELLFKDLKNE